MNHYDDHGVGDLKARISELEDEIKQQAIIIGKSIDDNDKVVMEFRGKEIEYEKRIAELEARVAQIKEFSDGNMYYIPRRTMMGLKAILSDTRKPLAVVEGRVYMQDNSSWLTVTEVPLMPDQPVTVVVMPKEGGDGQD